jgi:hypothetical protein
VLTNKLVLLEGIAGSGKSTIGQKLYRLLFLNGYTTDFYHEFCRPHPVLDVENESISAWINHSLVKWRRFVEQLSGRNSTAIMDGAVLQCGLGELLERGADDRTVLDYGKAVADILKPVKPILIYLFHQDIEPALIAVCTQRAIAWKRRIESHFADTAYGRSRSQTGFELYLEFNRSLRAVSYRFIEAVRMRTLLVDCTDHDWSTCLDKLRSLLKFSWSVDPYSPYEYSGDYACAGDDRVCQIHVVDSAACARNLFNIDKMLLPKSDDTLFVQTWPDELTFARDRTGKVESFRSTGLWNRIGNDIWRRLTTENARS